MKKTLKFFVMLAAVAGFASCNNDPEPLAPQDGRDIVYTVASRVSRTEVSNDAQWDALLDRFCDLAQEGNMITFYNARLVGPAQGAKAGNGTKESTSISTTSREEMKDWMREMERAGKTVNVTYDEGTGTWNGTAYATGGNEGTENVQGDYYTGVLVTVPGPGFGPDCWALRISDDTTLVLVQNGYMIGSAGSYLELNGQQYSIGDSISLHGTISSFNPDFEGDEILTLNIFSLLPESIVGRWHYYSMTSSTYSLLDPTRPDETTVYTPESVGNTIFYDFRADGTASRSRMPAGGSTADLVNDGQWSLTDGFGLCCNLFDSESCWMVQASTEHFMVLLQATVDNLGNLVVYQMLLRKVND